MKVAHASEAKFAHRRGLLQIEVSERPTCARHERGCMQWRYNAVWSLGYFFALTQDFLYPSGETCAMTHAQPLHNMLHPVAWGQTRSAARAIRGPVTIRSARSAARAIQVGCAGDPGRLCGRSRSAARAIQVGCAGDPWACARATAGWLVSSRASWLAARGCHAWGWMGDGRGVIVFAC